MENLELAEENQEIFSILNNNYVSNTYFKIRKEFFIDGWAIFLEELQLNPRRIIVFKDRKKATYCLKSYLIFPNDNGNEISEEIYNKGDIQNFVDLMDELRHLIFGKDLMMGAIKLYNKYFK